MQKEKQSITRDQDHDDRPDEHFQCLIPELNYLFKFPELPPNFDPDEEINKINAYLGPMILKFNKLQSIKMTEILEKFRNINREFILTHRFNYLYTFLSLISSCVQGDQLLLSFNDLSARIDKIISAYLKEVEDIVERNKVIDPYIGENINFDEIVDA